MKTKPEVQELFNIENPFYEKWKVGRPSKKAIEKRNKYWMYYNSKIKILRLTLKKEPFDVMVTGEKKCEYRNPSKWIYSRLYNKMGMPKHYDFVEFTNGYGKGKPMFLCEYKGFIQLSHGIHTEPYSNGFHIGFLTETTIQINLGKVLLTNKNQKQNAN